MLTNDQLVGFANRYTGSRYFRCWFDDVINWADNRDIPAEVCCEPGVEPLRFFVRLQLSDSKGPFHAVVSPNQGRKNDTVAFACSHACAKARQERIVALNGRMAAGMA